MSVELEKKLIEGLELFNSQQFFDCHEILEDVWNELQAEDKIFLQVLIQYSVSLHLIQSNRIIGARKVYARALANLAKLSLADANNYYHLLVLRISLSKLIKDMENIFHQLDKTSEFSIKIDYQRESQI